MWPDGGQSAGELRRFLITGEDLGVRWSADNRGRTAGVRDATGAVDKDENSEGNPAKPPIASAKSRTHTTIIATPGATVVSPRCAALPRLPGSED